MAQQGDPVSTAKNILSNANKAFPSSMAKAAGSTTGVNAPKPTNTAKAGGDGMMATANKGIAEAAKHSGSVADTNRQVGQEEMDKTMPVMHDGGVVKQDGPHYLQAGETVIPASGRQSEYRKVFEARGAAGKHKWGGNTKPTPAKEQTRQDGGNTPAKGEHAVKGEEHLEA